MNLDIFSGKVVLITGATGLIGSHIAKKLLELNKITIIVIKVIIIFRFILIYHHWKGNINGNKQKKNKNEIYI